MNDRDVLRERKLAGGVDANIDPLAGESCSVFSCRLKARYVHTRCRVPVCARHLQRKIFKPGELEYHTARHSRGRHGSAHGVSDPGHAFRRVDAAEGQNGEVKLKKAVKFCPCGTGITSVFTYCEPCFKQLPDEEQRAHYKARSGRYRAKKRLGAMAYEDRRLPVFEGTTR